MLRLAIMGDLHYPQLDSSDVELLQAREYFFNHYLKAFAELEADWHVSVGDLTHNGLPEEFQEACRLLRPIGSNFRYVLGNHDVLSIPKEDILSITGQGGCEAVETEEALMLYLDTTVSFSLNGCGLDAEQYEWLRQQMERSRAKPLFIFAHHPLLTYAHGRPPSEAKLHRHLYPLLQTRINGGVVFHGHTHYHKAVMVGSWYGIETAASLCFPCFRLIEVDSGQIRVNTIPIEDDELLRHCRILREGLPRYHRPHDALYHKADLHFTLSIPQP